MMRSGWMTWPGGLVIRPAVAAEVRRSKEEQVVAK